MMNIVIELDFVSHQVNNFYLEVFIVIPNYSLELFYFLFFFKELFLIVILTTQFMRYLLSHPKDSMSFIIPNKFY